MTRRAPPRREDLAAEYAELWATCEIRPERRAQVMAAARRIIAGKPRYERIESETRVPWWFVGLIHHMESGCHFGCHLHNGDSLARPTVRVPAGRPKGPGPFTWDESACDALVIKGLDRITRWDIATVAYELERYNGWGYRLWHPEVLSPYLWSMTNHYRRGKYVADGQWSPTAVSGQPGAMAILKELLALEPSIAIEETLVDPADEFVATPETSPEAPASMATSSTGNAAVVVGGGGTAMAATEISGAVQKLAGTGKPIGLVDVALALLSSSTFIVAVLTTAGAVYIWLERARIRRRWGV
jgi:lysozyme family protein